MSQAPHPLREKIIAHFYAGGRAKSFGLTHPTNASKLASRYGFRLEYVTQDEVRELMAKRRAKGLVPQSVASFPARSS
jgi:hypothetical protein